MRKVLGIAVFAFVAVVAAGWCISWYAQANESKKAVENAIARINANTQYLTYDSLETSGFPTHVKLTLTNPRFSGRMDELLRQMDANKQMFPHDLPAWQEDVQLQGFMTLTVNALSSRYSMEMNGKWLQNSDIEGKPIARLASHAPVVTTCSVELNKTAMLSNMWEFNLFKDQEHFSEQFRKFECASNSYAMVDTTSGETFLSAGPTQIFLSNAPNGEQNNIRMYLKYADMVFTTQGDAMISAYVKAIAPDSFYPSMYAYYGNQSMEVDFLYRGPAFHSATTTLSNAPFEFNLSKLNISNNLYTGSGHLTLRNEPTGGDNIAAALDTQFEFTYTKHYDDLIKNMVYEFIKHINENEDPMMAEFKQMLEGQTPEQAYTMVAPALPNLSPLGTWVQAAKLDYNGHKSFTEGSINLSNFAFTTTPYGITGSGSAKMTQGSPFPEANFNFICTSCNTLIDDATSYANRVLTVVRTFYPDDPSTFHINSELVHGIKQFLAQLSSATPEDGVKGTYAFAISSDPSGNMTVGGRNIMEVMALYEQYIGQQLMPSAGVGGAMDIPQGGDIPTQGWKVE
ncbi:MAG: hypothetical protein AB7F82_05120 [Alphaproteobacteria bacterium]